MKKQRAFTLIETIIAISVFCIWILTVLFWLSQTLKNQDNANLQIKSAFFAREWIELIFNLRDANYHKELPWNCIFTKIEDKDLKDNYEETENPFCDKYLEPWTVLNISLWNKDDYYIHIDRWDEITEFDDMFDKYQIYLHTWDSLNEQTWFIYNNTWTEDEKTWFARYLLITWVVEYWNIIDPNSLLKVESHVLYKRWWRTWEKIMETFIWNYEF